MKILASLLVVVIAILVGAVLYLQALINDNSVPTMTLGGPDDRLLFVFAHPDDEITVAGTLAGLAERGIPFELLYLTRGEAGPTGGLVPQSQLGEKRTAETERIAQILGATSLQMENFPDGGTQHIPAAEIQATIRAAVDRFQPSIIVSLDDKVGLYGHIDHVMAGKHTRAVVETLDHVLPYYQITLSQPTIDAALQASEIFRSRYPTEPGAGLPPATHAVEMTKYGAIKWAAVEAHETQWEILDDVQPFGSKVPTAIYYRIFNKEYFHRIQ